MYWFFFSLLLACTVDLCNEEWERLLKSSTFFLFPQNNLGSQQNQVYFISGLRPFIASYREGGKYHDGKKRDECKTGWPRGMSYSHEKKFYIKKGIIQKKLSLWLFSELNWYVLQDCVWAVFSSQTAGNPGCLFAPRRIIKKDRGRWDGICQIFATKYGLQLVISQNLKAWVSHSLYLQNN